MGFSPRGKTDEETTTKITTMKPQLSGFLFLSACLALCSAATLRIKRHHHDGPKEAAAVVGSVNDGATDFATAVSPGVDLPDLPDLAEGHIDIAAGLIAGNGGRPPIPDSQMTGIPLAKDATAAEEV